MVCDLLPQFKKNLESMAVKENEKVLIAVSGGPDSMALLHLFSRWNPQQIGVFHLNHGFRESASAEADFVDDYAKEINVPAQIDNYDVDGYLATSGESKQQGARKVRYRLLLNYAREHGYDRIALGHHGDDQAETILMRIIRGSGLHGLSGIPMKRGLFIRPLLSIYKVDIERYCHDFAVPYVEDESNFEPIYLRNKIRQELLPILIKEYNPEIKAQLVQLAELAREDESELQIKAEEICRKHSFQKNNQLVFSRPKFEQLSISLQRRVLRTLIYNYRGHLLQIGFSHIEDWRTHLLQKTTFQLTLPELIVSANQNFIFVGEFTAVKWTPQVLPLDGEVNLGHMTIKSETFAIDELQPPSDNSEDFDVNSLSFPLEIRTRKKGDRLSLFGSRGSKKVKDLLIDAKIPLEQRDSLPLICDQKEIIWIPTVRRGASAPLLADTTKVVRLSFRRNEV